MILHFLLKWCSIIDTLGSSLVLCSEYIKREVLILVALTTIYSFLKTPNPNFITPLTLLNPLFTNNKLQLPFSFFVCVSWFFLCILHIKGMPIPFRFRQVLLISRLFFIAQLSMCSNFILTSTTAIENSGTFLDSTFVSYELISTNNSPLPNNKIFFYGCYIQVALVECLTTWVPIEHKRDKPIIRMQIFYVLSKRT